MEINPEIAEILRKFKIDKSQGTLALLGIYFNLDIEKVCSEEVVIAINLTKIVEKDFKTKTLKWNVPLFKGQEIHFEWVEEWIEGFKQINPDRKGSTRDAVARMKEFFSKYPEYRKEDIFKARDAYFETLKHPKFCMHSHKFIFDGAGAMKKSTLLAFCERIHEKKEIIQEKIIK